MNQKYYFILFWTIMANTFLHGMRADCGSGEEYPDRISLTIKGNAEVRRFGFINESCNASLILDVDKNTATLVSGNEGAAIIFYLDTNETKYIPSGVPDPESVLNLSSDDLNYQQNNSGEISSDYSEEILELGKSVFECGFRVDKEKVDPKDGLEIGKEISRKYIELLKGDLDGVIGIFVVGVKSPNDYPGIYNVFEGCAVVFGSSPGGLKGLIEKNVDFKPQSDADSGNGLDALSVELHFIENVTDIGKDLGPVLNDPARFLGLVAQLGGMRSTGINGILRVLSMVACYVKGEVKLEVVINIIIQVLASEHPEEDLKECLNENLEELLSYVKYIDGLSGLVSTIDDIINGNLELDGVNLSCILDELLEGITENRSYSLVALVKIVLEITKLCETEEKPLLSILLVLIVDINNPLYAELIKELGIDVEVWEYDSNSSGNCDEDLYNTLTNLPGVKDVTEYLETALSKATDGELSLKDLVDSENSNELIKEVLQIDGYIDCGISERDLEETSELISEVTSLDVYFGIDVCPAECIGTPRKEI